MTPLASTLFNLGGSSLYSHLTDILTWDRVVKKRVSTA
jgi:hypothetical protein